MAKATILLADNDPDFLKTRTEFLEQEDYRVIPANSPTKAHEALEQGGIDLVILDIRLVNDDDEKDTSGLALAKDPAYRPVPKIILTNHPSFQAVREALGPALDSLPPAVDFLWKQEGVEAMIQAVDRAFARRVRLNRGLHIRWDQLEPLGLVSLLQPGRPRDILVHRADELEDLVRQIFYDYQQVRIRRLFWSDRWRFCLLVLAQTPQGAINPRILVCGERSQLEQELKRLRELAPETAWGTKLVGKTETVHFGAALYALPDAGLDTVQTLRDLFQSVKGREFRNSFNHLLQEVLAAWHQRGEMLEETRDLMLLYRQLVGLAEDGLSQTEVERQVEALVRAVRPLRAVEIERGDDGSITFYFANQAPLAYPDPVATIYIPLEHHGPGAVCKISPGQLTADNVLVDAEQRAWLTDFAHAGQAPQWWDFVCLEATVRFDLSQAPDLLAWQEFEECLASPDWLHDQLPAREVSADLRTNVALIEQIRRQASSEAGSSDPLPYYAGLLVWVVGAMARHEPSGFPTSDERMRAVHLLLASAMLADRLRETLPTSPPGSKLRLDDDGTVWIGGRRICFLAGHKLAFLRCLYERASQTVSHQTIVEYVFGEPYRPADKRQRSCITSLAKRVRGEIEPDWDHPRYIRTVRGGGYRLSVEGEPGE